MNAPKCNICHKHVLSQKQWRFTRCEACKGGHSMCSLTPRQLGQLVKFEEEQFRKFLTTQPAFSSRPATDEELAHGAPAFPDSKFNVKGVR